MYAVPIFFAEGIKIFVKEHFSYDRKKYHICKR